MISPRHGNRNDITAILDHTGSLCGPNADGSPNVYTMGDLYLSALFDLIIQHNCKITIYVKHISLMSKMQRFIATRLDYAIFQFV
jgi:hypothetical protein